MKRWLFRTLILVASAALAFVSFLAHDHYRDRHLRDAEARLNADDINGAIAALRTHVILYDDDFGARVRLGELVEDSGDKAGATRIFTRVVESGSYREAPGDYYSAVLSLAIMYDAESTELESQGADAFRASEFEQAGELFEKLIHRASNAPFVMRPKPKEEFWGSSNWEASVNSTLEVFDRAIANRALSQIMAGDKEGADSTLAWKYPAWHQGLAHELPTGPLTLESFAIDPDLVQARKSKMVDISSKYASDFFGKDDFESAAKLYRFAREQQVLIDESSGRSAWLFSPAGPLVAFLLFNEAIAENNAQGYSTAIQLFEQLLRDFPEYVLLKEAEQNLNGARKAMLSNEHSELRMQADKAFGDENWVTAITRYREAATIIQKHNPGLEAEDLYNMAMAYSNNRNRSKARSTLLSLQKSHPNYEPDLIREQLQSFSN